MSSAIITVKDLEAIFNATPKCQNILLAGKHGIGKSQIVMNYFKDRNYHVQTLFLGQMSDPGDIIGLPKLVEIEVERVIKDENGKEQKIKVMVPQTIFALPFWFPTDDRPIVLFLDELNRARPEVLQSIMDLALNRTIAGNSLPEGSIIVAAVNEGEEYQLTELDPALVDRFNVYTLSPTVAEWLLYATAKKLDPRVIRYLEHNGEMLDSQGKKKNNDLDKTPSRRSWEKVSQVVQNIHGSLSNVHKKLISGIVGPEAAMSFFNYMVNEEAVSGEDVILRYPEVKKKIDTLNLHERSLLSEAVLRTITVKKDMQTEAALANIESYVTDLYNGKNKEAKAHFASLTDQVQTYGAGIKFILKSQSIIKMVTKFIENI